LKNKYRIANDSYCGYEVQVKRWWFPIWTALGVHGHLTNTHVSVEKAEEFAKNGGVVKYI
jgi:hypothetical protein